jgi:hypothetical protein
MNLAGALLLGCLFGSAPAVGNVEQAISSGVRVFLGLPEECRIETTLHLESRGSLLTGMVDEAEVDLYDVDWGSFRFAYGVGVPSNGNLRGRVNKLKVTFHSSVAAGFAIERLTFFVDRVDFNLGKLVVGGGLSLASAGPCQAEVVIDPRELAKYIDDRSETLRDVEISLLGGQEARLQARVGIGPVSASVEVNGRLEIVEGKGVELSNAALRVGGLPMPELIARKIMQEINPVFSFKEGSFLAEVFLLNSLEFEEGKIVFRGEGHFPFLPSGAE